MKKVLVFIFSSLTFYGYSQSNELPSNWFEIIQNCSSYDFNGGKYVNNNYLNNSGGYGLQANYDRGFEIIQREWQRLNALSLINLKNEKYVQERKNEVRSQLPSSSGHDLSIQSNVNYWYNKCTYHIEAGWTSTNSNNEKYSFKPIQDEIILLKKAYYEIIRIKNKDPDNYYNNERFKSMLKLLNELRNCGLTEISKLSWKYNLY